MSLVPQSVRVSLRAGRANRIVIGLKPGNRTATLLNTISEHQPDRALGLEEVLNGLLKDGLVTDKQIAELLKTSLSDSRDIHPLQHVAEQGWLCANQSAEPLTIERLSRWLAEHAGLPYLRIDPLKIDVTAVTRIMSHAYASRFSILPVAVHGKKISVATAEPFVREWERELSQLLKLEFDRVIANPITINRFLNEFYAVSRSIDGAGLRETTASPITNLEQLVELGQVDEVDADDQHVVRIVDWLLQYAFEQRASDIHLEPRRDKGNIRFRIDGVLHLVHQFPNTILNAVVSRTKAVGRLDVVERRRPQDGRIKTKSPNGKEVEMRLSTMPTTFGEKLVMRIFDPEVLAKNFSELGLSERDEQAWRSMVSQPHGIVVVTGPTGSGKTTTLYSTLKHLAKPGNNVCTIEDPIELVDPQFNQMHVQHNIGLTFATGVRTLLRQDPDIIMVGEVRDKETADTAIQAALTGHLVLTTLHTNDAPSSITRFLDLGVAPYLIRASLLGVVAQRLVRTLCPHCKIPADVDTTQWDALVSPHRAPKPRQSFAAKGCEECRHTGFRGRLGIFEIMSMDEVLREQIQPEADSGALRNLAMHQGMRPLRLSGAEKVHAGLTTIEEVFAVAPDHEL